MMEIIILFNFLVNGTLNSSSNGIGQPEFIVFVALIGSAFGAIVAFVLFYHYESSRGKREIEKIKVLIRDDFTRIYRIAKSDMNKIDTDNIEFKIDEKIDKLISGNFDLEEFLSPYMPVLDFNFWEAIVSSGSLIKLEKEDIKKIQAGIDTIRIVDSEGEKILKKRQWGIQKLLWLPEKNKDKINQEITEFLGDCMGVAQGVIEILERTDLDWINWDKVSKEVQKQIK